ncbi:MAG: hypothetical protein K2H13_02150 [Eubacterium sp.]|nr:hypothetical protein [Eubacterium sp.]MDE6155269.1 hypothetical protein [Eubacterium sp.]
MNELLEIVADRPLIVVRAVIVIITVIGLTAKLIVPKIKERAGRIKDTSSNDGGTYLQKGFELYHSGNKDKSIELIIKGLELGERGVYENDIIYGCRILIDYYDALGEEYNSLRWGRFAVDHNCRNEYILQYMADKYEYMGEVSKAEEMKELLKKS